MYRDIMVPVDLAHEAKLAHALEVVEPDHSPAGPRGVVLLGPAGTIVPMRKSVA